MPPQVPQTNLIPVTGDYGRPRRPGSVPDTRRGGYNHGGPNPASNAALARAIASQNPIDAAIYAQRQALKGAPALGFEWASIYPPTSAQAIDKLGRAVVIPLSPTAQMTTTATELLKAMLHPSGVATAPDSLTDMVANITGSGEVCGVDIPAGYIAVIDQLGVDSWSSQAEYEIEWSIGVGVKVGTSAPVPSDLVANPQRGWRQGSINQPATIKGYRVIKATSTGQRLSVVAYNDAAVHGSYYTPAPHYVEAVIRGWLIPTDPVTGEPLGEAITNGAGAGVGGNL